MEEALAALFKSLGENELDSDVLSYLADVVRNTEDGDLEDLRDTCCGFSTVFESLSRQQQDAALQSMLTIAVEQRSRSPRQPTDKICSTRQTPEASCSERNSSREQEEPAIPAVRLGVDHGQLATLISLCDFQASEEFLADLLTRRCGGDMQLAAERVLDPGIRAERAAWEAKKGRQRQQTGRSFEDAPLKPDEELSRAIVAKFHLEAVPLQGADDKKKGKVGVKAWGEEGGRAGGGACQQLKTRFREGVVVSTKGEKFVVEKPPEWDGGSRGRVKSKRKGGAGWY